MKKVFRVTTFAASLVCGAYSFPAFSQEKTTVATSHEVTKEQFEVLSKSMLDESPDELKKSIQNGLDVNTTYQCNSLLNLAIKRIAIAFGAATMIISPDESLEKIKILIDAGADVNKEPCSTLSVTPLTAAIQLPFYIDELENGVYKAINNVAKTEYKKCETNSNPTACHEQIKEEMDKSKYLIGQAYKSAREDFRPYYMNTIKLIVENGADVNKKDSKGRTSIHVAAILPEKFSIEPLKYLIEKGANVNAQDNKGNTALFSASGGLNKKAVQLLLDAGADTSIWNYDGLRYDEVIGKNVQNYLGDDGSVHKKDAEEPSYFN